MTWCIVAQLRCLIYGNHPCSGSVGPGASRFVAKARQGGADPATRFHEYDTELVQEGFTTDKYAHGYLCQ